MSNVTDNEKQATAENLYCLLSKTLIEDTKHQLTFVSAFNIFLSIAAFLGNALILDALRKESSIHPPSKLFFRCLATTDICVGVITEPLSVYYWMSVVNQRWNNCRYVIFSVFFTGNVLTPVSLLTATAIGVDRLLALLLRLRYRQVVTVKRTFAVLAAFWIISTAVAMMPLWNFLVYLQCTYIVITVCLVVAIFTHTKIFRALRHHQNQIHDNFRQITPLNLARHRNAVSSALWVQLTMVVCYLPHVVVGIVGQVLEDPNKPASSSLLLTKVYAVTLVYLNSSLNPILYCWKVKSVRNAVKARVKQVLCC